MRILITGASGFIGSSMASYLNNLGYDVIGCGRTLVEQQGMKYILCDWSKSIPDVEADVIVHTAALSPSVNKSFHDYFENNVLATRNVIEYAKKHHVKRILYTGAVSSYGTIEHVLREDSPHNNPDAYGLTKYVAEQLIRDSNIPFYILILPGVVGKGCRDNWIMKAAETIYNNEDLIYYNGSNWFNNMLEIEDLCEFVSQLLKKETEESNTYLLGTDEMMTVDDVIVFLKNRFSSNSKTWDSTENRNSFYLDISRAKNAGFCSKAIKKTLDEVCQEVLLRGDILRER